MWTWEGCGCGCLCYSVSVRYTTDNGHSKSDTRTVGVQSYGRAKEGTRPVGFELRKKPKDLIASEREESGHGKGVGVHVTLM